MALRNWLSRVLNNVCGRVVAARTVFGEPRAETAAALKTLGSVSGPDQMERHKDENVQKHQNTNSGQLPANGGRGAVARDPPAAPKSCTIEPC